MSKAFTKEDLPDEADAAHEAPAGPALPPGGKNYISGAGFARLKAELRELVEVERPAVVKTVAWAASNGDRSENGDYLYGKKRLREIDRRVRFLIKRLENAEVVQSSGRDTDQVFFGAAVRVRPASGEQRTVTILGVDETTRRAAWCRGSRRSPRLCSRRARATWSPCERPPAKKSSRSSR